MSEVSLSNARFAFGPVLGSDQELTATSLEVTQNLTSSSYPRPRYLPILPLTGGGMANVELAVGIETGNFKKLAVLKTVREELAYDPDLVAMFLSEARLCARLNHANLVQVYEVMETPRPCIVMEYLEGLSVFDIQRALGQRFDTVLQLRIISDVLAGLHYAHELCDYDGTPLGIVHRDVSPQNVIVTSEGRVKVLDFGIAKAANSPSYTQAGIVKGKMSYMSPEQLAGEPLDRRTDVYAVGCMLWRAAAGRKLWARTPTEEIMRCLIMGKIPAPSIHRKVEPRLEEIVVRATAPDRNQRYESAALLRRAVDDYLAELAPGCELHHWMEDTFKQHWAEQRRVIRTLSSDATSVPPVETSYHDDASDTIVTPAPRMTKLVTMGIVAAVVGTLLLGTVGLIHLLESGARARGEPRVSSAREQEILLRLHAEPLTAQITVDATPLIGNPAELRVAAGSEHVVEVALQGYQTLTRNLRFDRETTLEFALVPVESNVPASAPTNPSHRSRSLATRTKLPSRQAPVVVAPPSEHKDPCLVPFYYQDGIKTYKSECL